MGTVLARIDDKIYKLRFEQAQAGLERAKAELTVAKAQRSTGIGTGAAIAAAEAAVAQSRAAAELAKINLDATVIRSPVKGLIISRRINVGQVVGTNPNGPSLFLIAKDPYKMNIWAQVNEADISRVREGMEATFTIDAYRG